MNVVRVSFSNPHIASTVIVHFKREKIHLKPTSKDNFTQKIYESTPSVSLEARDDGGGSIKYYYSNSYLGTAIFLRRDKQPEIYLDDADGFLKEVLQDLC